MWKLVFVGFPHTDKYHGGEVTNPVGPDETVEVSQKEGERLLKDFAKSGPGGKPAFRLVEKSDAPPPAAPPAVDESAKGNGKKKQEKAEQPGG